jgi:DNA-binding winged helix-turn-helix (wHTH) protein
MSWWGASIQQFSHITKKEAAMSSGIASARQHSLVENPHWGHRSRYRAGPPAHSFRDSQISTRPERISGPTAKAISFGLFRVLPAQRLLLQGDKAVPLGSRALDILIALVERPGELLGKGELMTRVWPDTFVEPANLTVHVAALRRALGDGHDGNRFIVNIPGRGYQFVAAVTATVDL